MSQLYRINENKIFSYPVPNLESHIPIFPIHTLTLKDKLQIIL